MSLASPPAPLRSMSATLHKGTTSRRLTARVMSRGFVGPFSLEMPVWELAVELAGQPVAKHRLPKGIAAAAARLSHHAPLDQALKGAVHLGGA